MRYSIPWRRERNDGSVGEFLYPISRMVRYWRWYRVLTVICTRPPTQWFSGPPFVYLIFFHFYPMRVISTNIYFSNDVSIGKGDFWNLIYSFVFFLNIPVRCYLWYGLSDQCLCHIYYVLLRHWGDWVWKLPGKYSQRGYQILESISQSRLCSV